MNFLRKLREDFTPVLTESQFYERGLLTPEEFVRAGDQLVRTCPSWRWDAGDKGKERSYLPPNKQFLVTRGVPSYRRVTVLNASKFVEGNEEGDWCTPNLLSPTESDLNDEVVIDASDFMDEKAAEDSTKVDIQGKEKNQEKTKVSVLKSKEDDYVDMEDDSLALDDTTNMVSSTSADSTTNYLLRPRRYDVSITYDNYYRTPRIWLFGFDESGSPLTPEAVFEVRVL